MIIIKEQSPIDTSNIKASLQDIEPISIKGVDQTDWEPVWNTLVKEYHYLGFKKMVGARIKYLAFSSKRIIAAIGFRAASLKLAYRDAFIGWDKEQRKVYLPHLANNSRFLIPPWVEVKNLGSYLLAKALKKLKVDWQEKYGYELFLVETFIDSQKFQGTIYRASNWIHLGQTKGYTKRGAQYRYHGQKKEVYVYPVAANFRRIIGCKPRSLRERPQFYNQGEHVMLLSKYDWHPGLFEEADLTDENIKELAEKLVEYHQYFDPCFNRPAQAKYGLVYLQGLMSDLEKKSAEPIALGFLEPEDVRNLQRFLAQYAWNEHRMMVLYQERTAETVACDDGMITIDSSEFIKKGTESVGVARQYCGRLGKVDNCQSGVFIGYSSSNGYALLDRSLYMPRQWFNDDYQERRAKCKVPQDLEFMTKPQIAIDLINNIQETELFPAKWLGCDSTFGRDHEFLDAIEDDYWYLASVPYNTQVWLERPKVSIPPYKGMGRKPTKPRPSIPSCSVEEIAKDPDLNWKKIILAEGAKGPIVADVARIRVIESRNDLPGEERWLYLRKNEDGEIKYLMSNAPKDLPFSEMNRVATLRWPIEQSFKEGKDQLGMDAYETRSWPGWHRHITYVFLAMLFLLEVRFTFKKKFGQPYLDTTPG